MYLTMISPLLSTVDSTSTKKCATVDSSLAWLERSLVPINSLYKSVQGFQSPMCKTHIYVTTHENKFNNSVPQ